MLFRMLTLEWVGVSAIGQGYFFTTYHLLALRSVAVWMSYLVAPTPMSKGTQVGFCLSGEGGGFLIYLSFEIA